MKRKAEILLLLLALSLVGCDRAPISADKMEDILFDIYRTDAAISVGLGSVTSEQRVKLYDSIFKKYGVTKAEFDETLDWYAHHSSDWVVINNHLVERSEEYVKRVENYEFSPHVKPVAQDSIDTFDLWMPKTEWEWREGRDEIDRRQTDYTLDDRKYFIGAMCLMFRMKMRCWSDAGEDSITTMMVLHYSKGADDTLRYKAPVDSVERMYAFTKQIPENTSISVLRVLVMDTVDGLKGVNVKDVKLEYTFNKRGESIRMIDRERLRELKRELRGIPDMQRERSPLTLMKAAKPQPSVNRQ